MKRALAALAFAAAAPAWAQTAAPQPQPQAPAAEQRATGTKQLNLNLNEADLRALSRGGAELRDPPAEQASDGLPTLGGDAKPMVRPKASLPGASGAYPIDSERATR